MRGMADDYGGGEGGGKNWFFFYCYISLKFDSPDCLLSSARGYDDRPMQRVAVGRYSEAACQYNEAGRRCGQAAAGDQDDEADRPMR